MFTASAALPRPTTFRQLLTPEEVRFLLQGASPDEEENNSPPRDAVPAVSISAVSVGGDPILRSPVPVFTESS